MANRKSISQTQMLTGVVAVAALGLAACTGVPRVTNVSFDSFYDGSAVTHASSGGAMPLVVRGNPYGVSDDQATAQVAQAMRLPSWFSSAPMAPLPEANGPSGDYRLVLVFNPERGVGSRRICRDLNDVRTSPTDDFRVYAVFCAGDQYVSQAFMTVGGPTPQPGTPAFRAAMDPLMDQLFPAENPDRRFFENEIVTPS